MRYVLCCTRTHARARAHTHTHRHTHESGHTFVHVHLLDNYACKQHTENSNAHRHTLKQVHAHTHTHTHMQLRTWCSISSVTNSKRFSPLMRQNTKLTGSEKCGQTAGAYHTHF
jgi:NAD-specific glutamate dehydrogenase